MRISVFGLGYVGAVGAGCLAKDGHTVIGVDPNQTKVDLINQGQTPIIEAEIGDIISRAVGEGTLRATTSVAEAVRDSDISFICVGTPSQLNGSLDLRYVRKVCEEIGAALRHKDGFHIVVQRSTVLPGTMASVVIPTLEEYSRKTAGRDFGVCNNPEFLREGTAVHDFYNPPKTVIGETDPRSGDAVAVLYAKLDAPLIRTRVEVAEMVKYADNAWHAVKVCFANEVGALCKPLGIDSHKVMEIFCQDEKLNLSPYYLKPGFAFGGSCLPKDVRALTYKARSLDLSVPLLASLMPSNDAHLERAMQMVTEKGQRKIGVLGFSFKAGTDDLRESPMVEVIERLIGKGYDVRVYDRNVNIARLIGANKDYILNRIPHISRLMMESMEGVLEHGQVIIVGNGDAEFKTAPQRLREGQVIVDFARISAAASKEGHYDGICW